MLKADNKHIAAKMDFEESFEKSAQQHAVMDSAQ